VTATLTPRPARVRPATPRWWADLAGLAAGTSLLVVTALWVHDGGLDGPGLLSIGQITGLWASDLLLLQVLLMARIPVVERAFGQDRLAHWHRWVGLTSFWLLVAHVVLITLGYGGGFLGTFWTLTVDYPGMLLAVAGTALILLVVATSIRSARRRLRYESWHLLHLYAYLGVGLALPHQLWTGGDFLSSTWATVYWWSLYAVAAAAVVAYRIGVPLWRNQRHRLVVTHVAAEGPGLTSVYLTGKRLDRLPVRAGQFFLWRFRDGPGWSRAHPYSLSAAPYDGLLRITVKDLGDGSARVARLRPGTRALFEGPYGKLTTESYAGGPVTLLACGIGVTPLLSLVGDLPFPPGRATLLYRARSEAETAFGDELEWFARHRGLRVVHLFGARADRESWLPAQYADHDDAEALRSIVPDVALSDVYICGPDGWAAAASSAAGRAGVPAARVHKESFAW
jgi:predicted ferric reductase